MMKCLIFIVFFSISFGVIAKLPEHVLHPNGTKFILCSENKITKAIFFDVVRVGLYLEHCDTLNPIFSTSNKLVRFHYLREVTGKQFTEGATEYLTLNLTNEQYSKCFEQYQVVNNSYVDVSDGDYYDLFYFSNSGLDLYLNNKSIGQLKNDDCELPYFKIWFGEKSMDSGFRKLLRNYSK